MTDWKPIESAPKDGTFVLLGGGKYYCEERDGYVEGPCVASLHKDKGGYDDWLIAGCEGGYVWVAYDTPTHWMPLPHPPQEGDNA